jgi:hypothetical protein
MNFLSRHLRRIQNPVPVLVGPAGSPYADSRSRFHTGEAQVEKSDARRLAQRVGGRSARQARVAGLCGRGYPARMLRANRSSQGMNNLNRAESRPSTFPSDTPHCAHSRTQPQTAEPLAPATRATHPAAAPPDGFAYKRLFSGYRTRSRADAHRDDFLSPASRPPRQDEAPSPGRAAEAPPVAAFHPQPCSPDSGSAVLNRTEPHARNPGLHKVGLRSRRRRCRRD